MSDCACGDWFRIEACDLRSGIVRAILHPVSADFQTNLNGVGQGTLTLATQDVLIRDIWPHLTSVYITRIAGGDASPENPYVEFAGMIEEVDASDEGATQVGLKSIEQFLNYRAIRADYDPPNMYDTQLAASLVALAEPEGIPLSAEAIPEGTQTDREPYHSWDRKNIGEAVRQITEYIDGPEWRLEHTRAGGAWSTKMVFEAEVGSDRALTLRSDREAAGYGLRIDASEHATLVDALGEGEEEDMLVVTARDSDGPYVRFDATPAWKDISKQSTLRRYAEGYLEDYREPVAIPSVTIAGIDPDPAETELGDTLGVRVNYGAVTYNGRARIIGRSWKLSADAAPERTFEMIPTTRASESVLGQVPTDECPEC